MLAPNYVATNKETLTLKTVQWSRPVHVPTPTGTVEVEGVRTPVKAGMVPHGDRILMVFDTDLDVRIGDFVFVPNL